MSSREVILGRLRRRTQPLPEVDVAEAGQLPATPPADDVLLKRFIGLASKTQMSCICLDQMSLVPTEVARYLAENGLAPTIFADLPNVAADNWQSAGLTQSVPPVPADGAVFVGTCHAALADCGAIVIRTRPEHSIANEFLAQTHLAVLPRNRLLPDMQSWWQAWRRELQASGTLPREYCLITGPSRTADLGLPAKLGAHGPARVHVLIVGD